MKTSPSSGAIADQSDQSYVWKSAGSTIRAWSFQTKISDRATVETRIGCQLRLRISVGRCKTAGITKSRARRYSSHSSRAGVRVYRSTLKRGTNKLAPYAAGLQTARRGALSSL